MTVSRLVARPLLASMFVTGPINALRNTDATAGRAAKVTDRITPVAEKLGQRAGIPVPHDPKTWVRLNAAVQLTAALALATGRAPRLSAAVLAGSLVPTTVAGHPFWEETDPETRRAQQLQFFKNLSLLGGLLIAAGDTEGRPGVAWRARHAAKDARRTARQEARLLKAKAHLG
jgi:putative oxidoreductase